MKKFIILSSFLLCLSAWSQETHSPQYKCTNIEDEEVKYVLIGNSFPQIPDLDYSHEVILADKDEYAGQTSPDFTYEFKVMPSENGFLTHKNEIDFGADQKAHSYLILNESYDLTHTLELPFSECKGGETVECFQSKTYHCIKQTWVDFD